MNTSTALLLAADLLLVTHTLFVAFVVGGLALILIGRTRWAWVRNPWFRWAHLSAIAIVVVQSWLGVVCPLTTVEMQLRARAGEATYAGSFLAHWIEAVLYYRAPWWVFVAGYTLFGLLVVAGWFWVRPRPFRAARLGQTRSRN